MRARVRERRPRPYAGAREPESLARRRHLAGAAMLGTGALLLGAPWPWRPGTGRAAASLATLLPAPPDGRAHAALVLDSRDCASHVALLDVLERPRILAAVGAVTVVVQDGGDGARRAADALLTRGMQRPVIAWAPPPDAPATLATLGAAAMVPTLVLLARDGRVVLTARAPTTFRAALALAAALEHVADHYVASELAPGGIR